MLTIRFKLRQYRQHAGLSQAELGQRVGVSQGQIGHIEMGRKSPSFPVAVKLAEVFNVGLDDLVSPELEDGINNY
jgi:DNA-binding XRE family transcriptional regulator